jgi:hypothetical protein
MGEVVRGEACDRRGGRSMCVCEVVQGEARAHRGGRSMCVCVR